MLNEKKIIKKNYVYLHILILKLYLIRIHFRFRMSDKYVLIVKYFEWCFICI